MEKYRQFFMAFLFLTCTSVIFGQKLINVHGTVKSESDGVPLPGVNISVKGTSDGTQTNFDGEYSIEVEEGSTLLFTYVGFMDTEVQVGKEKVIDVALQSGESLDQVMVIGYGRERKRDLTGAITQVESADVADMPISNMAQRLQGKMAGVQINQNNGAPGEPMTFRIRGAASINAGNSPLIVIDGFPSETGFENINPDDIESVSVLKDAASASLYGSRAASGVILVTTKKGNKGKMEVNFSSYLGLEKVPKTGRPNVMNAPEFAQFKKEYYEDMAKYEGYTGGVPERYQNPDQYSPNDGTDWYDVLLRTGVSQNYNLSMSSGTDKSKSYVSLNHNNEKGVILNTFSERTSVRSNNLFEPTSNLTFGLNIAGTFKKRQITDGLGEGRNIIELAYLMDPTLEYRNEDGTYPISFESPGMFANPNWYLVLRDRENLTKETRLLGTAFAEYEIIEGLKYKFSMNANLVNGNNRKFIPSYVQGGMGSAPPQRATGSYSGYNSKTWMAESTLTYDKTFWEKHKISALAGYSSQDFLSENSVINAIDFPDDNISWINAADERVGDAGMSKSRLLSYFGRLNYSFDDKYLVSVSFRRDGSSRFGKDNKWGNFPSISLGWVVSDEKFMENLDVIDFFKIRGNYGEVGNYNIGDFTHLPSLTKTNYVFGGSIAPGKSLVGLGNPSLTWEKTKSFDIGVDFELFDHRVSLTYDYYHKITDGLLYGVDIPSNAGFRSFTSNIGKFEFWGHEIAINTINIDREFKWNSSINISFDRNRVKKLGLTDAPIGGYDLYWDDNRTAVGHPIGLFYGFVLDGVYMTQEEFDSQPHGKNDMVGTARYKDLNGDGKIDSADRTFIGDPNPDFIYGITNEFSYKNFDLGIVMAGTVGNDIANDNRVSTDNIDGVFNVVKDVANRWRSEENPGDGIVPRTRTGTTESFRNFTTRMVSKGTYLAVKNITLGYELPVNNNFIQNARVFFSGQNMLIWSRYEGMNPEVGMSGLNGLNQGRDFSSYPISRIYSIGLNIKF